MIKNAIVVLLLILISSCKTIYIHHQKHQLAFSSPQLASIGFNKDKLIHNHFKTIGFPELTQKIRVYVRSVPFNKTTYKAYASLREKNGQLTTITYIDSLPNKPHYIQLMISDHVTLKETINHPENKGLLNYLKNDSEYKIVTSIAMVSSDKLQKALIDAEEIYLIQNDSEHAAMLQLIKNKKAIRSIHLSTITPFAYHPSSFCWGFDRKYQPQIEIISNDYSRCPINTYKKAYKLQKERQYLNL
ncbi:hypothetical protein [Leptobacterium sp. I13]|uniref:hypothetical protein n=1 Tax=Leptobacterium meishanense TaxID=3128904 RepID=UPI0030EF625F